MATCAAKRKPPVLPDAFIVELEGKSFTNGSTDHPLVADLYGTSFVQRFESVEMLVFANLGWGDEEVGKVADVLATGIAPQLQELTLGRGRMGDEGAACLAKALVGVPKLQNLTLHTNRIGDVGAAHLAEALVRLPKLQKLLLGTNHIGDEGAACWRRHFRR